MVPEPGHDDAGQGHHDQQLIEVGGHSRHQAPAQLPGHVRNHETGADQEAQGEQQAHDRVEGLHRPVTAGDEDHPDQQKVEEGPENLLLDLARSRQQAAEDVVADEPGDGHDPASQQEVLDQVDAEPDPGHPGDGRSHPGARLQEVLTGDDADPADGFVPEGLGDDGQEDQPQQGSSVGGPRPPAR